MEKLEQLKKEMLDVQEEYEIFKMNNSRELTDDEKLNQMENSYFFGTDVEQTEPRIFKITNENVAEYIRLEQKNVIRIQRMWQNMLHQNINNMERITDTHVYFWGSILSNWNSCKFTYKNIEFDNTEQAFMWEKAIHFKDYETADLILKTLTQEKIKNSDEK